MGRKEKISKERKEFIQQFIAENDIRSAHDIEIALRDMMKETLQEMLENELTEQLGYTKYEYFDNEKTNYRNGYSKKTVHSTNGDIELNIPRDRNGEFEPIIVEKGSKDISNIEEKIIRMYARGISNREIYNKMQELYGVKISPDMVTAITDKIRASTAEEGYENLIELREKWIKRNINLDNWINNWDNVSTFFK